MAHYLDESGSDEVEQILSDTECRILISSIVIAEFARRLWALGEDTSQALETALTYLQLFEAVIPVDVPVSIRAFELATTTAERVPLIDTLIAATAQIAEATLVHRDHHFVSLSTVAQLEIGK